MDVPILLIVRWGDGSAPAPPTRRPVTLPVRAKPLSEPPHIYTLEVRPSAPMRVGSKVRLVALAKRAKISSDRKPERSDFYDPHMLGTIVNIANVAGENGTHSTEVTISNECARSSLCTATVRVPPSLKRHMEELVWANREASMMPVADARMLVVWDLVREPDSCKGSACSIPIWLQGANFASHASRTNAKTEEGSGSELERGFDRDGGRKRKARGSDDDRAVECRARRDWDPDGEWRIQKDAGRLYEPASRERGSR